MAEKSYFWPDVNGDREYTDEDIARLIGYFVGTGIHPTEDQCLHVTPGTGLSVVVNTGRACIEGKGYDNTAPLTLTLPTASGSLPRTDAVVIRRDKATREIHAVILTGTPSSSAPPPSIVRNNEYYDLKIAEIKVVAGATSITQADIKDTRLDSSVCGISVGVLQQVEADSVLDQYTAIFEQWFENLENTLDENQATNLQNNINKLEEKSLSVKTNLTTEDLDDIQTTGIYIQNYTSNATTDRHYPVKASGCLMCISAESKAYQYYICQNEGCIWMRRYNSKSWSDWEQIYPSVTSGSNDRGTWIKYPDGTMICSIRRTDQVIETDGIVVTFPQEFADNNYTAVVNVALPYDMVACADCNYTATTNVWFYNLDGSSTAWKMVTYTMIAIGRWK